MPVNLGLGCLYRFELTSEKNVSHGNKRLVSTSRDMPTSRSRDRASRSRSRLGRVFERLGLVSGLEGRRLGSRLGLGREGLVHIPAIFCQNLPS